jgi:hypothetical protein
MRPSQLTSERFIHCPRDLGFMLQTQVLARSTRRAEKIWK